jgi:hypothetical protein
MKRRLPLVLLGIAWLGLLGAGYWLLLDFELSPGSPAAALPSWPTNGPLSRTVGSFDLLVFAHPRCPCTRATIGELAILMAHCPQRVAARVLFFRPARGSDKWSETDLWRAAAVIPGVTARWDDDGIEAKRFGARTSGQVFVYDPQGLLRFQGGITPSRGHAGDNVGREAICKIVEGATGSAASPVFGCPLEDLGPIEEGVSCKQ